MNSTNASLRWKATLVRLVIGIAFLMLALWPALSMRESLWIDELHSAWVIMDGWNDVVPRAALGNQSPLYFYGLKAWSSVFEPFRAPSGYGEGILRTSSLLGWILLCCVSLGAIFRTVPTRAMAATIAITIVWLWLDRIGAFYAIELRPYIWVAFMSLLMMISGANLANNPNRLGITWLIASILAFYLHYTAIIPVALSWLAIAAAIAARWTKTDLALRRKIVWMRAIELAMLAIFLSPGLYRLFGISNKSQQWTSFAGDASLTKVVDLLPWGFWAMVSLIALVVERWSQRHKGSTSSVIIGSGEGAGERGQGREGPNISKALLFHWGESAAQFAWVLQLCLVGFGSLSLVWLLTLTEIAPLLHRRYVLGAYPAFLLLGVFILGRIQNQRLLLATGVMSATLMIWWQGTVTEWGAGRWVAWQRQEDWRGAIEFLNARRRSDEPVFFVSNLIEARGATIDPTIDENYLRYPLTSLYSVHDAQSAYLLPNDRLHWTAEIFPRIAGSINDTGWIIARTQKTTGLEADLNARTIRKMEWRIVPVYFGGAVQVWKIEGH